jgi:hypothetical protein
VALAIPLGLAPSASADSAVPPSGREVWAGADISDNVWLVYSGVTLAPWSALHEQGWRFRTAGGYGGYSYDKDPARDEDDRTVLSFEAQTYFTDLLVGYLWRFGELTAKGFVGASFIGHDISPNDDETIASGNEVGFKGVVELWLNMGEKGWGSLDLSWSQAHETRAVRSRVGYRFWPNVSLGLEGGLNVDAQGECRMRKAGAKGCSEPDEDGYERADLLDYGRAGAFARYEWGTGEASVSAGVLGDSFSNGDEIEFAPYVTVNWLTQF